MFPVGGGAGQRMPGPVLDANVGLKEPIFMRIKTITAFVCTAFAAVAGIAAYLGSTAAHAATATTTFAVTATVQATCLITANPLAFGTYTGAQIATTTTVQATCTNTTPYNVGLNPGTATGATVATRKMTGPASATLNYSLYQDSAHTINWGQTVGTDTEAGTGNGSAQSLTIYGLLPAAQYPGPGSYTDTITATVT